MEIPKAGKLSAGVVIILLSVLAVTQTGGSCGAQTPTDDDQDRLLKGYRLCLEQRFEKAYGSFRVAWALAMMFENDSTYVRNTTL